MRIAIMQPYLLPYLGYFQLIADADRFVIYDRIKYTKKGWINRNRMLVNGAPATFTVPLAKAPDHLDIAEREIAESYDAGKLLARVEGAYRKAPHFAAVMPLARQILAFPATSLFDFLHHGIAHTCRYLGITTPIVVSSAIEGEPEGPSLQGQDRVINLCRVMEADAYVNPIGGRELYAREAFAAHGIDLGFIRMADVCYEQFGAPFQPGLSILDVMMFNDPVTIGDMLRTGFERVPPRD